MPSKYWIAREQDPWSKIAGAFRLSPASGNRRGVGSTDWITIDRTTYAACLGPRGYGPRGSRS